MWAPAWDQELGSLQLRRNSFCPIRSHIKIMLKPGQESLRRDDLAWVCVAPVGVNTLAGMCMCGTRGCEYIQTLTCLCREPGTGW